MEEADVYTERELVVLLKNDSPIAFKKLFDSYSQKLYHFAYSYLKTEKDAEEIVQEVFMKLWENRHSLKSDKSFKSYLFTIAFNSIRKYFNKKAKENAFKYEILDWLSEDNLSIENKLNFEELVDKLDRLVDQFPEKRKAIFIKRKQEGKSINEIADEMNISPKTVKNQITEAMNSLRKAFSDETFSSLLFFALFVS